MPDLFQTAAEEWRPTHLSDFYEVSDLGRVRSWKRQGRPHPAHGQRAAAPRIVTGGRQHRGHWCMTLRVDGRNVYAHVHRLVMEAFVGPCPEGMEVRHLDGDPENNRLDNLSYGTPLDNAHDLLYHKKHGRGKRRKGDPVFLSDDEAAALRTLGDRLPEADPARPVLHSVLRRLGARDGRNAS